MTRAPANAQEIGFVSFGSTSSPSCDYSCVACDSAGPSVIQSQRQNRPEHDRHHHPDRTDDERAGKADRKRLGADALNTEKLVFSPTAAMAVPRNTRDAQKSPIWVVERAPRRGIPDAEGGT